VENGETGAQVHIRIVHSYSKPFISPLTKNTSLQLTIHCKHYLEYIKQKPTNILEFLLMELQLYYSNFMVLSVPTCQLHAHDQGLHAKCNVLPLICGPNWPF
jgi:hypothetical protein